MSEVYQDERYTYVAVSRSRTRQRRIRWSLLNFVLNESPLNPYANPAYGQACAAAAAAVCNGDGRLVQPVTLCFVLR